MHLSVGRLESRVAATALAALLLGGCGSPGNRPGGASSGDTAPQGAGEDPDLPPPPGDTARARCEAFRRDALEVEAQSRDAFRVELGEPHGVESETEPNRHVPGAFDTLWVIRYDELDASIRTATGNDLLERVTVRGNRHLRYRPGIGTPEARLIELLGEPARREPGRLEYHCAQEPLPDQPTTFVMEVGRIAEIVFDFYVD